MDKKRWVAGLNCVHLVIECPLTLAKTEIIYPKNVGALVAMNFA